MPKHKPPSPYQASLFDPPAPVAAPPALDAEHLQAAAARLRSVALIATATGMTPAQAAALLDQAGDFWTLMRMEAGELERLPHVGRHRAAQFLAIRELALMQWAEEHRPKAPLRSPADAAQLVLLEMGLLNREELRVLLLNTKNVLTRIVTVYVGNVNTVVVRVGEVFREAIRDNSAGLILAHNHPSGDPTPSPQDVQVTQALIEAGSLLDIAVLDHLVIGRNRYVSLKEKGLGFK